MIDRRCSPAFPDLRRRLAAALTAAAVSLSAAAAVRAQDGDPFEIRRVAVDVTAETAAMAREQALGEGERTAFRRLLERLTLGSDHDRLPRPAPGEIADYVKDFEVAAEKASAVRYLATLNFRFKGDAVRRLLTDHGVAFAETLSKPVLVLPVYRSLGALLLWDEPNPWRDAWAGRPPMDSLVPTVLPLGDLADISAIGAEQAVAGDQQRLAAIAARYGAGDTLVAQATQRMGANGLPVLEVDVRRYGTALQEQTVVQAYVAAVGEGLDELLAYAALDLTRQIEDNWKRDNLLQFGHNAVIAVTVPITGLEDWLNVRKRLAGVAVVRRTDLVLLSRDEVRINLHYLGDPDQLALGLEQVDLALSRKGDDWILGLAGAATVY